MYGRVLSRGDFIFEYCSSSDLDDLLDLGDSMEGDSFIYDRQLFARKEEGATEGAL